MTDNGSTAMAAEPLGLGPNEADLMGHLKKVIDIELTLNRFGFGKVAENKFLLFCFRFSKWKIPDKYAISFEINWRVTK